MAENTVVRKQSRYKGIKGKLSSQVLERHTFLKHCKGRSDGTGYHIERGDKSMLVKVKEESKFSE